MKNKIAVFVALAFLASSVLTGTAYAGHEWEKSKSSKCDSKDGVEKKFYRQAGMIMKKLDLSKEQMKEVKALKSEVKKDLIRQQAEIDLVKVDCMSEMRQDSIDTDAVNALIDKKYDAKKAKAKIVISGIAKLNNILTKEQKETLKEMCGKSYKKGYKKADKKESKKSGKKSHMM
jgi:Spy/CpxP family protein refolding chaperone